jgi:hypothetical protein
LEAPLQVEKGLCLINIKKSWPLKGIVPTITSTPLYQIGLEVFKTELEVLCFHLVGMHTPSSRIKEDIEFPKVLNVKQFLEKQWELIT